MLRGKQTRFLGCVSGRAVRGHFGTGTRASKGRASTVAAGKGLVMRTERRLRIAWKAYLAELGVMQMLERPSEAEIAERFRRYFRWRLEEAIGVLSADSSALSEVLIELFLIVTGEDEIGRLATSCS